MHIYQVKKKSQEFTLITSAFLEISLNTRSLVELDESCIWAHVCYIYAYEACGQMRLFIHACSIWRWRLHLSLYLSIYVYEQYECFCLLSHCAKRITY